MNKISKGMKVILSIINGAFVLSVLICIASSIAFFWSDSNLWPRLVATSAIISVVCWYGWDIAKAFAK